MIGAAAGYAGNRYHRVIPLLRAATPFDAAVMAVILRALKGLGKGWERDDAMSQSVCFEKETTVLTACGRLGIRELRY